MILNKRYQKDEYFALREKIIKHMNEMPYVSQIRNSNFEIRNLVYRYGEFFPPELSPFAYNETMAQDFFPLTKDEARAKGYRWQDPPERNYEIHVKTGEIPDHIKDVSDDIVGKHIQCAHTNLASSDDVRLETECNHQCTMVFKITPQELAFYRKMNLPLPRLCPFCRIGEKFKQWILNLKLVKRACDKCGAEFETAYGKDRAEYVWCKACYREEVYVSSRIFCRQKR